MTILTKNQWIDLYQKHGWKLIPCKDKQRLTKDNEVFNIKDEKWSDCNIGVLTGDSSNLCVVDIDGESDADFVKQLQTEETKVCKTKRGYHYYFKIDKNIDIQNAQDLLETKVNGWSVDIRGNGGYVICPPSENYTWINQNKIKDLPLWLKSKITQQKSKQTNWLSNLKGIGGGEGRHQAALNIIGTYVKIGLKGQALWETVLGWNARNTPPLEEEWLEAKIQEILNKEDNPSDEENLFSTQHNLNRYLQHLNQQKVCKDPEFTTGFDGLDNKIWGFTKGRFHLILGVPNSGKSLTIDISAVQNALRNKKVLLFSTETDYPDVISRIMIHKYGIESMHFVNGQFTTEEYTLLRNTAIQELSRIPLYIYDDYVNIQQIEKRIEKVKPDIVYIDHFQEMDLADGTPMQAAKIVKQLKEIASKYNIPLVVASQPQVNTALKKMEDGSYAQKKVDIDASSVRSTKVLWQAAHLIITLNIREAEEENCQTTIVKVTVGKNKISGYKPTLYYKLNRKTLRYNPATKEDYYSVEN